jgi:Flp pilus assembly protein TadD
MGAGAMRAAIIFSAVLGLSGCADGGFMNNSAFGDDADTVFDTASRQYYPDDQLIVSGKVQFRDGNYGMAHAVFKRAVDVYPNDPQALLGYAASLDMLRRFDQSDVVYRKLEPMIGNRVEFHNNYGYSQLLRGNLQVARRHFLIAYEKDPSNPTTANNLELLRNSVSYPMRAPGDLQGI